MKKIFIILLLLFVSPISINSDENKQSKESISIEETKQLQKFFIQFNEGLSVVERIHESSLPQSNSKYKIICRWYLEIAADDKKEKETWNQFVETIHESSLQSKNKTFQPEKYFSSINNPNPLLYYYTGIYYSRLNDYKKAFQFAMKASYKFMQDKKKLLIDNNKEVAKDKSEIELVVQNGHSGAVNGILLTKDDKKMISWSADGTIKIWDVEQGKLLKTLEGHSQAVHGLQITKDERKLISYSSFDNSIKVWDLDSSKIIHSFDNQEFIRGVLITADEKKIISYGTTNDYKIKIWDLELGKKSVSVEHDSEVIGVKIATNQKFISYHKDGTIKIWEIATGKLLNSLEEHKEEIWRILLTRSGDKIISCSYGKDKSIKIWETETGKLLHSLIGHEIAVDSMQLSIDEKKLISEGGIIKVWDMNSGKLLNSFKGNRFLLSKDEKIITYYQHDKERRVIQVWDFNDGKLFHSLDVHTKEIRDILLTKDSKKLISHSADNTIKIWDIESGKIINSFEWQTNPLKSISGYMEIQLSKNEKRLLSFTTDGIMKIWDIEKGNLIKSIEGNNGIYLAILTNDDKKIITNNIKIWNFINGEQIYSLEGHTVEIKDENKLITQNLRNKINIEEEPYISEIILTNDQKKIISWGISIRIWNADNGKLIHKIDKFIDDGILTKDDKYFISHSYHSINIWDIETGKLIRSLDDKKVSSIFLSDNDKQLISFSDIIRVWDLDTGLVSKSWSDKSLLFTKDESTLNGEFGTKINVWEKKDGKLFHLLSGRSRRPIGIELTQYDKYYYSSSSIDGVIQIWELETGKLIQSIQTGQKYASAKIINNNTMISESSSDNTIKIWDISDVRTNGRSSLRMTLDHKSSPIINYTIKDTPAGQMLISFSSDGSIRYWDISDVGSHDDNVMARHGTPLRLTQLLFKNGESLYYTPDGYFDYTNKNVIDYISYVSSNIQSNFLDLQDMMSDYYYDGLLESILDGSFKPNKKNSLTKGVETTPMVKGLFETQKLIETNKESHILRFQITEKGSKLDHAEIFVNGVLAETKVFEKNDSVKLVDDRKENYFKYEVKFNVPLNYGNNRVELKVFNEFKIPQSFPGFELVRKIPENVELKKPDLYVLAIGINSYKKQKLTYSVSDAESIANAFKEKGELYENVYVNLLIEENAKKKEIESAFSEIESKVRPEDIVLVYMSGHGMNAFTREGKKLFYFVPQDYKWPDDPENENVARGQGIDADYLNDTFTKIKSHKLILILDACHSGSVNVALASRGNDKERATKKAMEKMANGTGRFIFASSSGNEESREHSEVGHGLYTYVLLNALGKGKNPSLSNADTINRDGFIYLSEIRSYIEQNFEDQTKTYLKGIIQTPPAMSLGRNSMHERINDFPLLKVK